MIDELRCQGYGDCAACDRGRALLGDQPDDWTDRDSADRWEQCARELRSQLELAMHWGRELGEKAHRANVQIKTLRRELAREPARSALTILEVAELFAKIACLDSQLELAMTWGRAMLWYAQDVRRVCELRDRIAVLEHRVHLLEDQVATLEERGFARGIERAAEECELVDAEEDIGSKGGAALRCAASIRTIRGTP